MKTNTLSVGLLSCTLLLSGCMQTRYVTERYIKNDIEVHTPKTFSTIRTFSIFKSMQSSSMNRYIELTGYKYNGKKGLVIGADRYYRTAAKSTGLPVDVTAYTYVELTEEEARAMYDNIASIRADLKAEKKPRPGEEVYHDYTVNEHVYISVRRSSQNSGTMVMDIWVKGEKYTLTSSKLTMKLKKFLDY